MTDEKYQYFYSMGFNSFINSCGKIEEVDFSKFSDNEILAFVEGWNKAKEIY